jgi:hypothetical protein
MAGAVSLAHNSQNTVIAVWGPNDSLDVYWNNNGQSWQSAQVAGADTTYSRPSLAYDGQEVVIAAEGPNFSLDFYYKVDGLSSPWQFSQVAGADTTNVAPSLASNGQKVVIAAVRPDESLYTYTNINNVSTWTSSQVAGPDSALGVPSLVIDPGRGPVVAARTTDGEDVNVYSQGGAGWISSLLDSTRVLCSSPWLVFTGSTANIAVEGCLHSLYLYSSNNLSGPWQFSQVAGRGTTFSPPVIVNDLATVIAAEGPHHSLDFYWYAACNCWNFSEAAGANTTYSPPSLVSNSQESLIAVQGVLHSLDLYTNTNGHSTWSRSLAAIVGTTYG